MRSCSSRFPASRVLSARSCITCLNHLLISSHIHGVTLQSVWIRMVWRAAGGVWRVRLAGASRKNSFVDDDGCRLARCGARLWHRAHWLFPFGGWRLWRAYYASLGHEFPEWACADHRTRASDADL